MKHRMYFRYIMLLLSIFILFILSSFTLFFVNTTNQTSANECFVNSNTLLTPEEVSPTSVSLQNSSILQENVYNIESIASLNANFGQVTSLALDNNNRLIASAYSNNSIVIWNISEGQYQVVLNGHVRPITSLEFSPDGSILASGGRDQSARIWDVNSGALTEDIELASQRYVNDITFHPTNNLVAVAADETIYFWDLEAKRFRCTLSDISLISVVEFNSDGTLLTYSTGVGDSGGQPIIVVYNLLDGHKLFSLTGHSWTIDHLSFSENGRFLASSSLDETVRVWDLLSGTEILNINADGLRIKAIDFINNEVLIIVNELGIIQFWDITDRLLTELNIEMPISGFFVGLTNNNLIIGKSNGFIDVWELSF